MGSARPLHAPSGADLGPENRVLLTGAGGFLGRHCLAALVETGASVVAVSRRRPRDVPAGVDWIEADLLDPASPSRLMERVRPDHLLHLAWMAVPGEYWTSLANYDWVAASLTLLRAFARSGGRRVLGAGSCAEYDWTKGLCREGETPLVPTSPYGVCKNTLRELLQSLAGTAGLSWAWGRIFFLYGPGEPTSRLVPSVARSVLAGREARCTGGRQRRDFLHVADAARAMVTLLASSIAGPVNIASGRAVPVAEVAGLTAALAGRPDLLRLGALPEGDGQAACVAADIGRLATEVGFSPAFDLECGLRDTVDWWRGQEGNR